MSGDRSQRTEDPTAKRKKELRKKGQVARSQALVSWILLLVATFMVPAVGSGITAVLVEGFAGVRRIAHEPNTTTLLEQLSTVSGKVFLAMVPLFIGVMIIGVVGNLAQAGFVFTFTPLKPKFDKVSPIAGVKRLFSAKSLWETAKQLLTVGLIALVAVPAVIGMTESFFGSGWALGPAMSEMYDTLTKVLRMVAGVGCALGVADFAWQRFNLRRDSRMTKQEVKQEHKESEGDPHLKAKLRSNQMAVSRNRMLAGVAHADVVITNPTHVSVALTYDPLRGAPRVVARGADKMAARIRERARDATVPIVESPPLAQVLFRTCRLDDEIPAELFQAVATVLAFVRRIERRSATGDATPLSVPDTWTVSGESPDTSLLGRRPARPRARRAQRPASARVR